jgi:hypothetical protein
VTIVSMDNTDVCLNKASMLYSLRSGMHPFLGPSCGTLSIVASVRSHPGLLCLAI